MLGGGCAQLGVERVSNANPVPQSTANDLKLIPSTNPEI